MKSIKVSEKAQQELKIYAAKAGGNMSAIASEAILQYLKARKLKSVITK